MYTTHFCNSATGRLNLWIIDPTLNYSCACWDVQLLKEVGYSAVTFEEPCCSPTYYSQCCAFKDMQLFKMLSHTGYIWRPYTWSAPYYSALLLVEQQQHSPSGDWIVELFISSPGSLCNAMWSLMAALSWLSFPPTVVMLINHFHAYAQTAKNILKTMCC